VDLCEFENSQGCTEKPCLKHTNEKGKKKEDDPVKWYTLVLIKLVIFAFQYKYRDLTVRQTVNVIAMYKDLKPVLDSYGKFI
jgi:hypothetical protein